MMTMTKKIQKSFSSCKKITMLSLLLMGCSVLHQPGGVQGVPLFGLHKQFHGHTSSRPFVPVRQQIRIQTTTGLPRGGGGTGMVSEEEAIPMVVAPPVYFKYLNALQQPITRCSAVLLSFVETLLKQCQRVFQQVLPHKLQGILSSPHIIYSAVAGALGFALVGAVFRHVMVQRQTTKMEYLMWDAKELVPKTWAAVEQELKAETPDMDHDDLAKMLQRQKALQDRLWSKVNQAKALQVVGIYQKHFPEQWKDVQQKQVKNMKALANHPRLLKKMTRHISQQKFTALLRPDYSFGIGRSGIDLTQMTNIGMVDPLLLKQVTEDLMATSPTEYPDIWEHYTSKLLPQQTLWDRHDLVLKMVKDVQLQKSKQGGDNNRAAVVATDAAASNSIQESSLSGGAHFNATTGDDGVGRGGKAAAWSSRRHSSS